MYRLFAWEHSYFSGKAMAYLRYKSWGGDLAWEPVLATPELLNGLLLPATGTSAIPQLQTPEGEWIQDTSEIIDFCEGAHPTPRVTPDAATTPRQAIACHLLELMADEWLVVPGFLERWKYSLPENEPNHLRFNEQQWGAVMVPDLPGDQRRAAGAAFFENAFGISEARTNPRAVYAGLIELGVTEKTESAWEASCERVLQRLERHFSAHDFVLGGRPSLGDFGLMGPLYAHLFRDASSSLALHTRTPLVCEWVERTNGTNALNARTYGQQLYSLGEDGGLVGRPANTDGAEWLPEDALPETLDRVLDTFFEEMWPMLDSTIERVRAFIASADHEPGGELPGKTFTATPGFGRLQAEGGPLNHSYRIGDVEGHRMVSAYHVWMLQRLAAVIETATASPGGREQVAGWLGGFANGPALLDLDARLTGCRVRKQGGSIYSVA